MCEFMYNIVAQSFFNDLKMFDLMKHFQTAHCFKPFWISILIEI